MAASVNCPFLEKTDRHLTLSEQEQVNENTFTLPLKLVGGVAKTDSYTFHTEFLNRQDLLFGRDSTISEELCYTTLKRLKFLFDPTKNPNPLPDHITFLAPQAQKRLDYIVSAMVGYPVPSLLDVRYLNILHGFGAPMALSNASPSTLVRPRSKVGSIGTMPLSVQDTVLKKMNYLSLKLPNLLVKLVHICSKLIGVKNDATELYLSSPNDVLVQLRQHWQCPTITMEDVHYLVSQLLEGKRVIQWVETLRRGYCVDEFADGVSAFTTNAKNVIYMAQNEPPFIRSLSTQYKNSVLSWQNSLSEICDKIKTRTDAPENLARKTFKGFIQLLMNYMIYNCIEYCVEGANPLCSRDRFIIQQEGFSFIPIREIDPVQLVEQLSGVIDTTCGSAFSAIIFWQISDFPQSVEECLDDDYPLWTDNAFITDQPGRVYAGDGNIMEMHFRAEAIQLGGGSYNMMKLWFERSHIYALDVALYYEFDRNDNGLLIKLKTYTSKELKITYEALTFTTVKRKADGTEIEEQVPFPPAWTTDNAKKQYRFSGDYPPPAIVPPDTFNTWVYSPYHDCVLTEAMKRPQILQRFLDLLAANCSMCQVSIQIQLVFLAHMVQEPGDKPGIALIYQGGEGTGKSLMGNYFMNLIGKNRSVACRATDALTNFNSIIDGKLLVLFDEILAGKEASAEINNQLKSIITDKHLSINEKHRKQKQVDSYHRIICTTNEPVIMNTERRPQYMKSNLSLRANAALCAQLFKDMEDPEGLRFIYHYLQHFDIGATGIDIHKPPSNQYTEGVKQARDPTLQFMRHLVDVQMRNHISNSFFLSTVQLYKLYEQWANDENNKRVTFGSAFKTDEQIMKHSWTMTDEHEAAISNLERQGIERGRTYHKDKIRYILNIVC